jgi:hypothetical protein
MAKPWFTSSDLIASVKRKISFPTSQNTFSDQDILAFANEELAISQVPSIMIYHEEYFVYSVTVPLVDGVDRYQIPDRAIGMKMRDLKSVDVSGNLVDISRISPDDKAYWQATLGTTTSVFRFYIEGNDVVLTPQHNNSTGSLIFYIYLRPNQMVPNDRAAICTSFSKTITVDTVLSGDSITIGGIKLVAGTDFAIGGTPTVTATNITTAINATGLATSTNGSPASPIVTVSYMTLATSISSSNATTLAVQATQGIVFNQAPSTWTNPDTLIPEPLFVGGAQIDFLQTKPGHRMYKYDVSIPLNGVSGSVINFKASDVPTNFVIGDYVCLANECIIPQIPPDLHNGLAERTSSRILAAIGDQEGLQASQLKIQEIDKQQGTLLDNRAESSPLKVSGRKSLLRYGKRGNNWRV